MAFYPSPAFGYHTYTQSDQREFPQVLPQPCLHNGYDVNIYEGHQQQELQWTHGCLQEYAANPTSGMPPYFNQFHQQNNYQPDVYKLHHYPPHNVNTMPTQLIEDIEEDTNIELTLENKALWETFSQLVTEMIITRAGRYHYFSMF